MKSEKKTILVITIAILAVILLAFAVWVLCGMLSVNLANSTEIEIHTDITEYNDYMVGENAKENYKVKLGMDESIFPEQIREDMNVRDYKMIYYNPWDPQYLGYLVVSYEKDAYAQEMERLKAYESTKYKGYYGVTGFSEKYTLVAMYADETTGFVYALSDRENTIIYVEIIYCNYFMDLDYKEYIPNEYLPIGFDATINNPYRSKLLTNR